MSTLPLPPTPEWQEQALCRQMDPDAFFPDKGDPGNYAKNVCKLCTVRTECLEYALTYDQRYGVWGGLSEKERRNLQRRAAA